MSNFLDRPLTEPMAITGSGNRLHTMRTIGDLREYLPCLVGGSESATLLRDTAIAECETAIHSGTPDAMARASAATAEAIDAFGVQRKPVS